MNNEMVNTEFVSSSSYFWKLLFHFKSNQIIKKPTSFNTMEEKVKGNDDAAPLKDTKPKLRNNLFISDSSIRT